MRRYSPLAPSKGTTIPTEMRQRVVARDRGCVGYGLLPGDCIGGLELDHVRASHGMGMKSETSDSNLVVLCNGHHLWKTTNGKVARALLLDYLERAEGGCSHVDPVFDCDACQRRVPA